MAVDELLLIWLPRKPQESVNRIPYLTLLVVLAIRSSSRIR